MSLLGETNTPHNALHMSCMRKKIGGGDGTNPPAKPQTSRRGGMS